MYRVLVASAIVPCSGSWLSHNLACFSVPPARRRTRQREADHGFCKLPPEEGKLKISYSILCTSLSPSHGKENKSMEREGGGGQLRSMPRFAWYTPKCCTIILCEYIPRATKICSVTIYHQANGVKGSEQNGGVEWLVATRLSKVCIS